MIDSVTYRALGVVNLLANLLANTRVLIQERLDFAMKEMVFDLLCVGRPLKALTPER